MAPFMRMYSSGTTWAGQKVHLKVHCELFSVTPLSVSDGTFRGQHTTLSRSMRLSTAVRLPLARALVRSVLA
jgi:hypothetical protein